MGDVLRGCFPHWAVCRAALVLGAYLGLVFVVSCMLCVAPAQALISTTGYARVASQAAFNAYTVSAASLSASSLSPAVAAASTGSVALRMVAGPLGWASLGVSAGLVLGQIYYSNAQVQAIRNAVGTTVFSIPGYTVPAGASIVSVVACPGDPGCIPGSDQFMEFHVPYAATPNQGCTDIGGWTMAGVITYYPTTYCYYRHPSANTATAAQSTVTPATPAQIQTYVGGLPATDPNSLPSNTTQVGVGVSPQAATSVVSQNVDPASLPTTVVPAATVSPTSVVVDPSAPAPAGTQTSTATSQTSTTATTTTTDPVTGVVTKTDTETAVSSCTAGQHDARTMGTILEQHLAIWKGSGIAGALSTLQTLSWPSTSPTYTLNSGLLGTFTFDFTAWNAIFVALRTLIIAGASFAAYRIVFVGGSGGAD